MQKNEMLKKILLNVIIVVKDVANFVNVKVVKIADF
jgi:hypothetical protein